MMSRSVHHPERRDGMEAPLLCYKAAAAADQSVQGRGSAAAWTDPLRDRFGMRAFAAWMRLLACPAGA